jgi:hypothetical protein
VVASPAAKPAKLSCLCLSWLRRPTRQSPSQVFIASIAPGSPGRFSSRQLRFNPCLRFCPPISTSVFIKAAGLRLSVGDSRACGRRRISVISSYSRLGQQGLRLTTHSRGRLRRPLIQTLGGIMKPESGMRICDRCGEEITAYCPSLPSLSAVKGLASHDPASAVEKLHELEGANRQLIAEYLHHRVYSMCTQRVAFCPFCGGQLKTWRAKLCLHCHKSWHNQEPRP